MVAPAPFKELPNFSLVFGGGTLSDVHAGALDRSSAEVPSSPGLILYSFLLGAARSSVVV